MLIVTNAVIRLYFAEAKIIYNILHVYRYELMYTSRIMSLANASMRTILPNKST